MELAPLINGKNLQVQIGTQVILDGLDLTIHEGERVGLVGRNGSGKSTLLKILAAVQPPDAGEVITTPGLRSGFLPQEFELDDSCSARENILRGADHIRSLIREYEAAGVSAARSAQLEHELALLDGWDLQARLSGIAHALSVPELDRPVQTMSGGERRRVALARAIIGNPDLLILDEPTNHLDISAIEWLEEYLLRCRSTVLMVTHDRYFLDRICGRFFDLSFGKIHSHTGRYQDFLEDKAKREADAIKEEAKRQSFLRREIEWVRRGPKARTTKDQGRLKRFYNAADQEGPQLDQDVDLVIPPADRLGDRVIELDDVAVEIAGKELFSGLSLNLEAGMRLGIVGPNGAGKTTLMRLIMGEVEPARGEVRLGARVRINYVDQSRLQLDNEKTVFEDVGEGKDYVMLGNHRIMLWSYLKRFLFEDERIRTKVGRLSGGERNRALLAKILKHGGNVLLMDEPTNDLDLDTLRILEDALVDFAGCVLVVSHDRYFLNHVVTGILGFDGQGNIRYQEGDYDYYHEKYQAPEPEPKAVAAPAAPEQPVKRRKFSWKEARELESIEADIASLEEEIDELETRFSQPDFYEKHGQEVPTLTAQLNDLKASLDHKLERWADLEEKKAEAEA